MTLKILLPYQVFAEKANVNRVVADTQVGSLGLLPHRLDCVAALVPGILMYQCDGEKEVYVAVDDGVIVKAGSDVLISVRRAIGGTTLVDLRDSVKREFLSLDAAEKSSRQTLAKLETGLIRGFVNFDGERAN